MKQPWQQQQEQIQHMQQQQQENMSLQREQIRQQQEMGHWYDLQKKKKGRVEARGGQVTDKFAEIKAEAARLRQDMLAGQLSKDQFKARLHDLMLMDESGTWWMVGAETLEWYSSRGAGWVRASPPGYTASKVDLPRSAQGISSGTRAGRRIQAIILFFVCTVVTVGVGFGLGAIAYDLFHSDFVSFLLAVVAWASGLVLSIISSRKVWRSGRK